MKQVKSTSLIEQQKLEVFRGSHTIVVPLEVQVEQDTSTRRIIYPVPEDWKHGVTAAVPFELIERTEQWGFEHGEPVTETSMLSHARKGFSVTAGGANTEGLLESFLSLADKDLGKRENADYAVERVVRFVKHWGPLWLCRARAHSAHRRRCYWTPGQAFLRGRRATPCTWEPMEEVEAFLNEAQQARAALEAIATLKKDDQEELAYAMQESARAAEEGRAAPAWRRRWGAPLQRRQALLNIMSTRLRVHGRCEYKLLWLPAMREPSRCMASPVGFLPAVWLEMVEILCGGKGVYQCADCHRFFSPKRQPKTGQNPFCTRCGEGNRGPAKLAMRRKRAAARMRDSQGMQQESTT